MSVPERYWRFPTAAAIDSLALRFALPNDPGMQDWEIEVADATRIDEFLQALESEQLTPDERFTLAELIMASLDEAERPHPAEDRFMRILVANPALHAHTILYWACLDSEHPDQHFPTTPFARAVYRQVRDQLP